MPDSGPVSLVRAIGRWSMAALVINSIIGSGIFGLPSDLAKLLGNASPYAVLIAGGAMGVIMACFAEVASRFTQTGGPYLDALAGAADGAGSQREFIRHLSARVLAARDGSIATPLRFDSPHRNPRHYKSARCPCGSGNEQHLHGGKACPTVSGGDCGCGLRFEPSANVKRDSNVGRSTFLAEGDPNSWICLRRF